MPCGEDGTSPPRSSRQRHAIPVQRGEKEQTNATRGAPNTSSSKLPRSAHKNRASLRNPQPEDTWQLPVPCVMRALAGPSTPAVVLTLKDTLSDVIICVQPSRKPHCWGVSAVTEKRSAWLNFDRHLNHQKRMIPLLRKETVNLDSMQRRSGHRCPGKSRGPQG